MLRRIWLFAFALESIATSETCEDEEIMSALQQSKLQDRSAHRRNKRVEQTSFDQAVSSKKGGEAKREEDMERSTHGKSDKNTDQLEKDVEYFERRVQASREDFSAASKQVKDSMKKAAKATAEYAKMTKDEIKDLGSATRELASAKLMSAKLKAEEKLLSLESKLAAKLDDIQLKIQDKYMDLAHKAEDVQADMKNKLDKFHKKSQDLQDEITIRMMGLANDITDIKDTIWNAYKDKLEPKLDEAREAMNKALEKVGDGLNSALVTAAEAAEETFVLALIPVVIASEQLEKLGKEVEHIRVKTHAKLQKLKKSAQIHFIQGKEFAKKAVERAAGKTKEWWTQVADTVNSKVDELNDWRGELDDEFERQATKAEDFILELEDRLESGVKQLNDALVSAYGFAGKLKDKTEDKFKASYKNALIKAQKIQDLMRKSAVEFKEIVLTKAKAAKQIAHQRYDELKGQLKRVQKSAAEAVQATKATIEDALEEARERIDNAEERARRAAKKVKDVADKLHQAAAKAGEEFFEDALEALEDAVNILDDLLYDEEWADPDGGKSTLCQKGKTFRFGTGSELKDEHKSFVWRAEQCHDHCKETKDCAFWVRYRDSRDCHLFDSSAVVKIDRSRSNPPLGGPVDCTNEY